MENDLEERWYRCNGCNSLWRAYTECDECPICESKDIIQIDEDGDPLELA